MIYLYQGTFCEIIAFKALTDLPRQFQSNLEKSWREGPTFNNKPASAWFLTESPEALVKFLRAETKFDARHVPNIEALKAGDSYQIDNTQLS